MRNAMKPLALTGPAHDQKVPFAGCQHQVVRVGTGRNALDGDATGGPWTQHERTSGTEHNDGDQRLVQPTHLPIAVETLEVVAVAIEDRRHTREGHPEARLKVQIRLAEHRVRLGAGTGAQPTFRHVVVVPQDLGLLPGQGPVQFVEQGVGMTHETGDDLDPRRR